MGSVGLSVLMLLLAAAPRAAAQDPSSPRWPGPRRCDHKGGHLKPARPPASPDVPVSLELELSDAPGRWRDAVADVGRRAGFRLDERAGALLKGEGTRASVRGWLPLARLGQAASCSRVRKVETAGSGPPGTALIVGLRLPEGLPESEFVSFSLARLREQAGFEAAGTLGIHQGEDGRRIAVVSGGLPVRGIRRLLADPAVVRVAPYLPSGEAAAGTRRPALASFSEQPALLLVGALTLFSGLLGLRRPRRRSRRLVP